MKNQTITQSKAEHTATPWATDGRMIVQEVEGRSFWSGQPFIADCLVSQSTRPAGSTAANAQFICRAANSHAELLDACKAALAHIEVSDNDSPSMQYWDMTNKLRAAIERAEKGAS